MDTLSRILDDLAKFGATEMIVADSAIDYLSEEQKSKFKCNLIDDVRSAGFFALGKTQTLQRSCILLVESKYISHLYTSMVETWFQQMAVVIVVLNTNNDVDYELFNRYIKKIDDYREQEYYKELTIANNGPTLIILNAAPKEHTFNTALIENLLPEDALIYKPSDKYGAISKYTGHLCGTSKNLYCVIPLEWVRYDLNIFNNRYKDKRFKLILLGDIKDIQCDLRQWLYSNQIELIDGSEKTGMENFLHNNKPSVIILK